MRKYFLLSIIIIGTIALYLWPDFHPDKWIDDSHHWYDDLIIHGGYFLVTTTALLLLINKKPILYAGIFFIVSIVLELLQHFSFNRVVDAFDVLCNFMGILLSLIVYSLLSRLLAKYRKTSA
jgi:hypothetical protein